MATKKISTLAEELEKLEKSKEEASAEIGKNNSISIKVIGNEDIVITEKQNEFLDALLAFIDKRIVDKKAEINLTMFPVRPDEKQ